MLVAMLPSGLIVISNLSTPYRRFLDNEVVVIGLFVSGHYI